jgi:hypothetical protein
LITWVSQFGKKRIWGLFWGIMGGFVAGMCLVYGEKTGGWFGRFGSWVGRENRGMRLMRPLRIEADKVHFLRGEMGRGKVREVCMAGELWVVLWIPLLVYLCLVVVQNSGLALNCYGH